MCHLRNLRSFNINPDLLQIFYSSMQCFQLCPHLLGGNFQRQDKDRLVKIVRKEGGIVSKKQDDLNTLFQRRTTNKMLEIVKDPTYPLLKE